MIEDNLLSEGIRKIMRNAIVTGARTGIGRATVEKFASKGINVWACGHKKNESFEEDMAQLAQTYGVWIKPIYFDLENEEEIKQAIRDIIKEKLPVDILVNNAGIPHGALLQMTSMKDLKRIFEINFFSQILIMQMVSKIMMRQKCGSIINLASVAGIDGDAGYTAYGSSKAAFAFATKVASNELAQYGIRVNAVAPGLVQTTMGMEMDESYKEMMVNGAALKRIGNPSEIANTIAFLASEEASFITGQVLRADGGL